METQNLEKPRETPTGGVQTYMAGLVMVVAGVVLAGVFLQALYFAVFLIGMGMGLIGCGLTFFDLNCRRQLVVRKCLYSVFVFWLLSFFIVEGLIFLAAKTDADIAVNYLIVLGSGTRGDTPSPTLKSRLDSSMMWLGRNPDLKLIVSGGPIKGKPFSEAEVMKRYLVANGVDENKIIVEELSTTTRENIKYTKQLIDRLGTRSQAVAVVTSDFHLFRAKYLARKYYPEVYGIASATPLRSRINNIFREYFAIMKLLILHEFFEI